MGDWMAGLVAEPQQREMRGNAKRVADVLRMGPKTTEQIVAATGLTTSQVREVFRRHRGVEIVAHPVTYTLSPTYVGKVAEAEKKL